MNNNVVKHFDMARKPVRQKNYLRPLTWILSYPAVWKHGLKIEKNGIQGLKPPFLLLCTHMAFLDFKVTTAALFPQRANYIVAIDGFIGREWLLRKVGCICKRKFTNDINLIRQVKYIINVNKDIIVIYPEARYSLVGTTAILPDSLGKLAKLLKVPVVVLNMHGNYLNSPVWNLADRGNHIEADMTQIISQEQLKLLTVDDINDRIRKAFEYDEYAWQKRNGIRIEYRDRAKGLHKVLYQCASCLTEFKMGSDGSRLRCGHCGKEWNMTELGELQAINGETEFSHIPDWYEFERKQVRKQIDEKNYTFSSEVAVDSLPNAKGYIRLGTATLTHDLGGFRLEGNFNGKPFMLVKGPLSMYSCHIEYDYMGKGDCIDLSTMEDTYYLYPAGTNFSATKIALATEELFKVCCEANDRQTNILFA